MHLTTDFVFSLFKFEKTITVIFKFIHLLYGVGRYFKSQFDKNSY